MTTVAVIDYGMGNLHSVAKALEHVKPGVEVRVTVDHDAIMEADHVILPGVGAIRDCMAEMKRLNVDKLVKEVIASGKPFLGICVGFQSLMDHSEENGGVNGMGVFPGNTLFFGEGHTDAAGNRLKVPHMGWNQVKHTTDHPLWEGIPDMTRFYFVHSYYVQCTDPDAVMATCEYGVECHVAAGRDNVFAVQFHPEKSQNAGLQLLKNFLHWDGRC